MFLDGPVGCCAAFPVPLRNATLCLMPDRLNSGHPCSIKLLVIPTGSRVLQTQRLLLKSMEIAEEFGLGKLLWDGQHFAFQDGLFVAFEAIFLSKHHQVIDCPRSRAPSTLMALMAPPGRSPQQTPCCRYMRGCERQGEPRSGAGRCAGPGESVRGPSSTRERHLKSRNTCCMQFCTA